MLKKRVWNFLCTWDPINKEFGSSLQQTVIEVWHEMCENSPKSRQKCPHFSGVLSHCVCHHRFSIVTWWTARSPWTTRRLSNWAVWSCAGSSKTCLKSLSRRKRISTCSSESPPGHVIHSQDHVICNSWRLKTSVISTIF